MLKFLRQKEKEPYSYPSIEMRKSTTGYVKPIAIIILTVAVIFIVLLNFH